jgi:subtilase family serine protease
MVDTIMKKGAALGESIFISAGDHGAAGSPTNACVAGTSRNVSEMSADPNVTSVGGTRFAPNYDSNGNDVGYSNNERTWNDPETGDGGNGATGGGESTVYPKPSYQSGPGVPADGMRDIPDIALIAGSPRVWFVDDKSGSAVTDCCAGGTSLSAPIWAGFTRVLSQIVGSKVGPLNPEIYSLARQQFGSQGAANGFHDITVGDNNFNGVTGFTAGPGYDQASGWGTIDFNTFASAVKNNAVPTPTPVPLKVPPKFNVGAAKAGTTSVKAKLLKVSLPKKKGQVVAAAFGNPVATLTTGTNFLIDGASTTCLPASTGFTLAPGKSCAIGLKLKPSSKGPVSDTLTIFDNASGNPQHVPLTGKGT